MRTKTQAILVTNLTANLSTETMKVRRHWAKIWMGNLQMRKWKWNVILKELGKMSPENSKSRNNILLKWIYFPHKVWKSYQCNTSPQLKASPFQVTFLRGDAFKLFQLTLPHALTIRSLTDILYCCCLMHQI